MSTYVADFLHERRKLPREQFIARYPDPCLVFKAPAKKADTDELTVSATIPDKRPPASASGDTAEMQPGGPKTSTLSSIRTGDMLLRAARAMIVISIRKTGVNLYQDKITVGRASNNDVILPSNSVSKFHAFFRRDPDDTHTLTDSGSKNGTFLDWQPMPARQAMPLLDGVEVIFGELPTRYYGPEGFYDFLARFLADK